MRRCGAKRGRSVERAGDLASGCRLSHGVLRLVVLLVLIACGALLTVAIAWIGLDVPRPGIVVSISDPPTMIEEIDPMDPRVVVLAGGARITSAGIQRMDNWAHDRELRFATDGVSNFGGTFVRSGWPMRAMHGSSSTSIGHRHAVALPELISARRRPPHLDFLPIGIVWPGFAVNTIFAAALLYAVFIATTSLRRAMRLRGGKCPQCRYPMGSHEACTECGSPLPEPAPRSRTHE